MNHTEILFHTDAQNKLLAGATKLADAVRITLGPRSQNVLIQKKWGSPIVCNDGVTIAKEIQLKDSTENLGAQMLREVAEKTGDEVGDGTSTATILAHAILSEGIKNIVAGANAIDLKSGLEKGLVTAVNSIKTAAKQMVTNEERIHVATISAHNDSAIGKVVADAVSAVGSDGAVTVEEATGTETKLEIVKGMNFDRGYRSAYFVTNDAKMESALEKPLILIYEKKLSSIQDLVPLLEKVVAQHRPLVIIADDIEGDALATLVVNKIKGLLLCVAVQAPAFGDRKKAMLQDIAAITGANVISEDTGKKIENATLEDLGQAEKVLVNKDSTTIIGGIGSKDLVSARIKQIKEQIANEKSDYEKEKLQERLSKITGGVAVIRVGAITESELKSKKEAFDDAISSVKAASSEGIVAGGGVALLRASEAVLAVAEKTVGDERTALLIMSHALEQPLRQIATNSGVDSGVVVNEVRKNVGNWGLDAATKRYGDLFAFGIIDSAKVMKVALENAVSIASLLLLTRATMIEVEEPEAHSAMSPSEQYASM